jgi:hypothetical protein
MRHRSSGSETGSAIALLLVMVVICGGVSAAALVSNSASHKEAGTEFESERAFQLAESGADWAVTQVRIHGIATPLADFSQTVPGTGSFTVRYAQGDANGLDDNGDGVVDEAAESEYATMRSTGTAGRISRTIQVVVKRAIITPTFDAPLQFTVASPILDFSGSSFLIDGDEHRVDGTLDPARPPKYGIASPSAVTALAVQVPAKSAKSIIGLGTSPSLGTSSSLDLAALIDAARAGATIAVTNGTQNDLSLGTPTAGGTVFAYCPGDLHLSGSGSGAGVLVVDGDLSITGGFTWVGILIVRGQLTMSGGGGTKVVGAVAVGSDISANTTTKPGGLKGSVEIAYSTDAITLATANFAVMTFQAWREVANP